MAIRNSKNLEDIYEIMKDQISFMKNLNDDSVESNAKLEKTFKNNIETLIKQNTKNDLGRLNKEQIQELNNISGALDNIYDTLRDQMYYMKDSADDNKKVIKNLGVTIDDVIKKIEGTGTQKSSSSTTPGTEKKSIISALFGGISGFIAGTMAQLKSIPFKWILQKAGILGAMYFLGSWIVDGISDYKKYLGISPDDDLSLRQKIVAATSGIINGFGRLFEKFTGIKLFDEQEVVTFIDNTTKEINNNIKILKAKFPLIGDAFDFMLDGLDEFLNITGDFLRDLFSPRKIDLVRRNIKAQKRLNKLKSKKETDLTKSELQEIKDLESEIKTNKQEIKHVNKKTRDKKTKELKTKLKELKELKKEEEGGSWSAKVKRRFLYGDEASFDTLIKKTEFQLKQEQKKTGTAYQPEYNKNTENEPFFKKLGEIESGNNYGASNKYGYTGKYQFSRKTAQPYLTKLGVTWEDYKNSPQIQEQVVRMFTEDNKRQLENAGITPTDFNLWLAHNQGVGGTKQILSGNISPEVRRNISTNLPEGGPATAENYLSQWRKKFNTPTVSAVSTPTVREDVYTGTEIASAGTTNVNVKTTPTSASNANKNSIAQYQLCEDEEIMLALLRSTGLNKVV